jgi:hypothetical protein
LRPIICERFRHSDGEATPAESELSDDTNLSFLFPNYIETDDRRVYNAIGDVFRNVIITQIK